MVDNGWHERQKLNLFSDQFSGAPQFLQSGGRRATISLGISSRDRASFHPCACASAPAAVATRTMSWRPDMQCIHFWFLCAGVSSPRDICLCHLAPLPRPFLHHLAHPLVVLAHSGVLRRAGHKSLPNGLFVFRLTDDKRGCGTHHCRITWNLSNRMAACGARPRYWIGCTRTGSPHHAHFWLGRQVSALDTSTSLFVVDSAVPRFTE